MLLDNVVAEYNGNLSLWVGFILLSWSIATFFTVMFDYSEQRKIKDKELAKQKEETDKLIKEIKGRL
jgi:large-conductance mechanosensitive channel